MSGKSISPKNSSPKNEARPIQSISDLTIEQRNANLGTERGNKMLRKSLEETGAGRSIVVDKDGNVIGGNHALVAWADMADPEDIVVVQTDGRKLVVVQRTDLDDDSDDPEVRDRTRALAYYDNRTNQVNLAWDFGIVLEDNASLDLAELGLWNPVEMEDIEAAFGAPPSIDDLRRQYGNPKETDFWPALRLRISPETMDRFAAYAAGLGAENDDQVLASLLDAAEGITGEGDRE